MTIEEALRAYAAMINTLDISKLEPYLSEDFRYTSQMVLSDIVSKHDFLIYMSGKLATIRNSGSKVWAEMGIDPEGFPEPCVILSQNEKENLVGTSIAWAEFGALENKSAMVKAIGIRLYILICSRALSSVCKFTVLLDYFGRIPPRHELSFMQPSNFVTDIFDRCHGVAN